MLQFILGFLTGSEMISLFRDGLDTERERYVRQMMLNTEETKDKVLDCGEGGHAD